MIAGRLLYQSFVNDDASFYDSQESQNTLTELLNKVNRICEMDSFNEYEAQKSTGIVLSDDEIAQLLGSSYAGQLPASDAFVTELINMERQPSSLYDLQQIASESLHITSLTVVDEYGFSQTDTSPGKFEISAKEIRAVVHFDDLVLDAGETLQLVIDGEVVDEVVLRQEDLDRQSMTLVASEGEFNAASGADLNIVVRSVDLLSMTENFSEAWLQEFG